jgi:hypothetical protein
MTSEADQCASTAESRPIGRAIDWIDYRPPIFTFRRRQLNNYVGTDMWQRCREQRVPG